MFRSKLLLIFLLCTTLLIGCATQSSSNQTPPDKPKEINASYVSRPINIPSVVAKEKKMFEEEFAKDGIEFKWHDIPAPSNQLEALASKSLDFSNSLNYVSVILAKASGNDIKVISSYSRFPKGISLVVTPNGSISTIADLKGKKIALQKGTMLHEMLIRALAEVNLTTQDLELVNMDSNAAATAIATGQVDATILPEPLLSKTIATGKVKKLRTAEGLISGLTVIAVRSEFAQTQPELVKRFLKVHKASVDWSKTNLEEAFSITATQNQLDIKGVKNLYPAFNFDISLNDVKSDLQESASFLQKEGMIRPDVDINKLVEDLVDPSYLPTT
ncbi:ABC transporter substrate-binding protein [Desulfosporosinus meridiei]|uniref:ABC transporter, substrate-binding protein, aliphatic sulfonates family n=1 Tax=Desulfosporosinus meridiei (strain ATCC BAA-275 / DSM 13257 / KCTC 12902 / NCIMB 13706 / S10) TaxID=768704 RepID=J7IVI5_DESMD|nr:NrtA/SsuA/CpmA family ABC transporter substrate-binding protein [Desulfosporosinus meridiei]AFQ42726.1 ABC transporter, substrate-binding protein, aliphatic sulfonates family [Desulfosporosinus meridiei DSM 13257]